MPPRLQVRFSRCQLPQPSVRSHQRLIPMGFRRCFANEKSYVDRTLENSPRYGNEEKESNMDQLPHVSEEAAAMSKVQGKQGPEIEEHGTPVEEVAAGDKNIEKHLPKVMKEQIKANKSNGSGTRGYSTFARSGFRTGLQPSRSFSTSSRRQLDVLQEYQLSDRPSWMPTPLPTAQSSLEEEEYDDEFDDEDGHNTLQARPLTYHKFGLPEGKVQRRDDERRHLKKRYEPVVDQVTRLLMQHGKLATAQKNMSIILAHLTTSPAPRPSPAHPILLPPGQTAQNLPLDPVLYLSTAIDSVAPLFRLRAQKGIAGGGAAVHIPIPLKMRQRRRAAMMWILDAANKRKGGTSMFPKRVAEELVAIVEGRSSTWEKRTTLHSMGVRARVNLPPAGGRGGARR